MATFETARNKYVSDSVHTMSPGHLIVAIYDRVLLDLERALAAMNEHDIFESHNALIHAQQIVDELFNSLDLKQWPGGESLAAIYRHVQGALIDANVRKDPALVLECRALLVPIRDAWREAAGLVNAGGPA